MLSFILNRLINSFFIIIGVVLVTFLLFKVSAGDPALTILGKNPKPSEIENLRDKLSSNLPIIYGHWLKSEIYPAVIYETNKNVTGINISSNETIFSENSLLIKSGTIQFVKRKNITTDKVQLRIIYKGEFLLNNVKYSSKNFTEQKIEFLPTNHLLLNKCKDLYIKEVAFYKYQNSAYNSQIMSSFKELITFKDQFPYISLFNFGNSVISRDSIKDIILSGIIPSISVMFPIFIIELILSILFAMLSTIYKDTLSDRFIMLTSISLMSISYLVLIIFGQWFFAYYLKLTPVWGYSSTTHLILPVLIGTISGLGGSIRFYRTVFINELNKEYLKTALAKGCSKTSIYFNHLLRNAMIPIITRASSTIPFLFTGSLLLESFFGIPGLGYAGYNALANSDLQLLKAIVIISAILFTFINFITDLSYGFFDPRISITKK